MSPWKKVGTNNDDLTLKLLAVQGSALSEEQKAKVIIVKKCQRCLLLSLMLS
jgi:hypothetical protein